MKIWAMALCASMACQVASAQPRPLPTTPDEHYALGRRFAECSARVTFVAAVAQGAGLTDTAKLAEGVARGWKVAGTMILVDGLAASRQAQTEEVFDTLVANKLDELRAWRELNAAEANARTRAEFDAECQPWADTQKTIIELMRRGG